MSESAENVPLNGEGAQATEQFTVEATPEKQPTGVEINTEAEKENLDTDIDPETVPLSADKEVPLSSDKDVPISSDKEVPLSPDKEVPISSDKDVPISSDQEESLSADEEVPISADEEVRAGEVPPSSDQEVLPGEVQYIAASPQQAEAVYIHNDTFIKHSPYQGKLSMIFGILLIILQTLAIVLNIAGAVVQGQRERLSYIIIPGNFPFYIFSSVWCGFFVYIAAGFAIGAGKTLSRGLIIAHLVMACIACVFSFLCACVSCVAVLYESDYKISSNADKASVAIAVLWLVACWVIFFLVTWCAALCCKVLCCGRGNDEADSEAVTPINITPIEKTQSSGEPPCERTVLLSQ